MVTRAGDGLGLPPSHTPAGSEALEEVKSVEAPELMTYTLLPSRSLLGVLMVKSPTVGPTVSSAQAEPSFAVQRGHCPGVLHGVARAASVQVTAVCPYTSPASFGCGLLPTVDVHSRMCLPGHGTRACVSSFARPLAGRARSMLRGPRPS